VDLRHFGGAKAKAAAGAAAGAAEKRRGRQNWRKKSPRATSRERNLRDRPILAWAGKAGDSFSSVSFGAAGPSPRPPPQ